MANIIGRSQNDASVALVPETAPRPDAGAAPFGCVFLTASAHEAELVSGLIEFARIHIYRAVNLDDAESLLSHTRTRVLLSNTNFRGGGWRDVLRMVAGLLRPAAVVVASEARDERLWVDVLERGAYDFILKPFCAWELNLILKNGYIHATTNGLRYCAAGPEGRI